MESPVVILFHISLSLAYLLLRFHRLPVVPFSRRVRQYRGEEERAFPGKGNPRDEEIQRLQREIEILKETLGIFINPRR